tara:strand:- start:2081 stop:3856 length:1776 start_codon:yes stop_codon:yes gene_type:complete
MKYKTISDMFYDVIDNNSKKEFLFHKVNNVWNSLDGSKVKDIVESLSRSLLSSNLTHGDKVSILSTTSYKWALCDYSIICSGMTTVTIYPTLIEDQIKFIINNSDSKIIFVEDIHQYERVLSVKNECPKLEKIILMNFDDSLTDNLNLTKFIKLGENNNTDLSNIRKNISENDLVTLIYTSGTTGVPKGVMLTHKNLLSNIEAVSKIQKDIKDEKFLSFLPVSHILERMAGHFYALYIKSQIYYAENMETVGINMAEVSPSVVVCVPRFFEKMHAKIMEQVNRSSNLRKNIFNWSLQVGKDYMNLKLANHKINFLLNLKYHLSEILVYKKIRAKLGGNIKFFISGGAPLSRSIAEFFSGIGITILEGYGLTETSPVLTSNTPEMLRFGTVGKSLNNVKIKIAQDGEILAKGPNIMLGYYQNEKATNEVIDTEGWFHTGDIGEIDKDGFLKITDRKKSLIVTSAGKNIAPAPLENALLTSKYIDQVIVIGDKRNFISALIVPSYDVINTNRLKQNKDSLSNEAIIDHPEVVSLIEAEIQTKMKNYSKFETIKKFKLLSQPFAIERGEMTPKMSIVRKKVESNYSDIIDNIYN